MVRLFLLNLVCAEIVHTYLGFIISWDGSSKGWANRRSHIFVMKKRRERSARSIQRPVKATKVWEGEDKIPWHKGRDWSGVRNPLGPKWFWLHRISKEVKGVQLSNNNQVRVSRFDRVTFDGTMVGMRNYWLCNPGYASS